MKKSKLLTASCHSCTYRHHHLGIEKHLQGGRLHSGETYCLYVGKKPKRFKKTELKKAPPTWCPMRKNKVVLTVYDFVNENERQMFTFLYDYCGGTCISTVRHQVVGTYEVNFDAQGFWDSEDKDALLGDIHVADFGIILLDDGLKLQCFFKERDVYIYQPYMVDVSKQKGEAGA
ncbi:hypothetical protein RFF05_14070 [Bengtsoniella intestinalis]|uniref:hypothetical protein n=1 Tax=Bengtsoniella intestinalis TaxID=3073143 RepID=UPI00391EEF03